MSVAAAGYILRVPLDRRELLLHEAENGGSFRHAGTFVAEPVPVFRHSRRAPLVVFASFEDDKITHLGDGKRGVSAGTGLSKLNMRELEPLAQSITFTELKGAVPAKLRPHLTRVLSRGGLLPPKTLGAFVDGIIALDASVASRLARFSKSRKEVLRRLRPHALENLAFQKETLGIALELSGISRDALLEWQPTADAQRSFLDGLPGAHVREDAMLLADFSTIPGFEPISDVTHYSSKVFENPDNRSVRVTVIMANRLPLARIMHGAMESARPRPLRPEFRGFGHGKSRRFERGGLRGGVCG